VGFIQNGGFVSTTDQKRAREIMGKNFFGVEEAIKYFGVNPNRQQLAALSEIPFSEAVLEQLKDTHVLVAVFPLSILDIRDKLGFSSGYDDLFCDGGGMDIWYIKESFAKERSKVIWQLVGKTIVDKSTSKTWQEQQALIGEEEEIPTAQVMIYVMTGHYLATDERLFENILIRTSSMCSCGHVCVGNFNLGGHNITAYRNNFCIYFLGVSSARKVIK